MCSGNNTITNNIVQFVHSCFIVCEDNNTNKHICLHNIKKLSSEQQGAQNIENTKL